MQTTRRAYEKCSLLLNPSFTNIVARNYQLSLSRNSFHTSYSSAANEKPHKPNKNIVTAKILKDPNDSPVSVTKVPLSKVDSENDKPSRAPPPEPPSNCCRSNCANCVWIQYALEMTDYYKDGGSEALKFLEDVDDPALKAFLRMELRTKLQENSDD